MVGGTDRGGGEGESVDGSFMSGEEECERMVSVEGLGCKEGSVRVRPSIRFATPAPVLPALLKAFGVNKSDRSRAGVLGVRFGEDGWEFDVESDRDVADDAGDASNFWRFRMCMVEVGDRGGHMVCDA